MKKLKNYLIFNQNTKGNIQEGLITRKVSTKTPIRYKPETNKELQDIIVELLKKGITDLNCIDVTNITYMQYLFANINNRITVEEIDISEWNVSNVEDMNCMFFGCKEFNSDLSKWDVSGVEDMYCMFYNCYKFNCDLSNWDVSNVVDMKEIFSTCKKFNSDLSNWDVSNVENMAFMFWKCEEFNSDLSNWDVSKVSDTNHMFFGCNKIIQNNKIPNWYNG